MLVLVQLLRLMDVGEEGASVSVDTGSLLITFMMFHFALDLYFVRCAFRYVQINLDDESLAEKELHTVNIQAFTH